MKDVADGKKRKKKGRNVEYEYVSDEDHLYGDKDDPDPQSREYFYDEVDEFHANREKVSKKGNALFSPVDMIHVYKSR